MDFSHDLEVFSRADIGSVFGGVKLAFRQNAGIDARTVWW
jgi:hypothetical protein